MKKNVSRNCVNQLRLIFFCSRRLFHREYSHIGNALQLLAESLDIGFLLHLTVVDGIEYFGFQRLDDLYRLVYSHGVGLIHG